MITEKRKEEIKEKVRLQLLVFTMIKITPFVLYSVINRFPINCYNAETIHHIIKVKFIEQKTKERNERKLISHT